jgi:flavin-dependent dehydrogenase
MNEPPVIIGAGPAGTAAAIRLAQAGHQPMLIERAAGPTDKVCGDFIGIDAIRTLRGLCVDPQRLGAAPIHRLRLIHRQRVTETTLPFPACGLSRRLLDEALLHRALAAGARVRNGQPVRRISRTGDHWLVDLDQQVQAPTVFLATGKHDLRDLPRPGVATGAVGMKMYYRLAATQTAELSGTIELILFAGGYAGLQSVEDGISVLCIALKRTRFGDIGGTWPTLLETIQDSSQHLRDRLNGATPLLPRPLAVAGVPYGLLHHAGPTQDPGLFRLGDQAAVIPSLTGDGIAIALHSGTLAADTWQDGADARTFHQRLEDVIGRQMRLARLLHVAALTGPVQGAALRLGGWFPGLLQHAARGTRVGGWASRGLYSRAAPPPATT